MKREIELRRDIALLAKMTRLKLYPIFRNLFDFRGSKLCDLHEAEDGITLFLHCTHKTGVCPGCGTRCSSIEDTYTRTIRALNLGQRKCFLVFDERSGRYGAGVAIEVPRTWTL
jgi:hypothetical protein